MKERTIFESHWQYHVSPPLLELFRKQAEQKIQAEGWGRQGRNVDLKIRNFVQCWITEEAFKQILIREKKWFRYRGLYFGDAAGAGADFVVKIDGKEISLGLRSINADSLHWKSVAYPDDRFREEKEKIADYHVVCTQEAGKVFFLGAISKGDLLWNLECSVVKYSSKNQEKFRVVPLEKFTAEGLQQLLLEMDH